MSFGGRSRRAALGLAALVAVAPVGCRPAWTELTLPARTVELRPSRDDLTVGALWIQIRCAQELGAEQGRAGGLSSAPCAGFTLDGAEIDGSAMLEPAPVAKNTFRLDERRIRFPTAAGGHLCIAVRAVFNEVSPRRDVELYADPADRYSLLSYCSGGRAPGWAPNRHVFDSNRVATFEEFTARLAEPIPIPLREPAAAAVTDPSGDGGRRAEDSGS